MKRPLCTMQLRLDCLGKQIMCNCLRRLFLWRPLTLEGKIPLPLQSFHYLQSNPTLQSSCGCERHRVCCAIYVWCRVKVKSLPIAAAPAAPPPPHTATARRAHRTSHRRTAARRFPQLPTASTAAVETARRGVRMSWVCTVRTVPSTEYQAQGRVLVLRLWHACCLSFSPVSIGACETPPIDSLLGELGDFILINSFCQNVVQFSRKVWQKLHTGLGLFRPLTFQHGHFISRTFWQGGY